MHIKNIACHAVLAVTILLSGCASTRFDHMATTNWVDRHIVPDSKKVQWIMTPVLIPITLVTLTVDNLIVAPIVHTPSAFRDAKDWMQADVGGYYTELGIFPIRAALCPVLFAGSSLCRTFFAVETRKDAAWGWPEWGQAWVRGHNGELLGPPSLYDPVNKQPKKVETSE